MDQSMGIEEEWLSQILGTSTKSAYLKGLSYFKEFCGLKTYEDLKTLEKPELRTIQFFQWLQTSKGLTANSARARCTSVQSFYAYIDRPLKLKHKLPEITPKVETWRPSVEELQKIYACGDLVVKCWMSLSRDIPARIGDMLTITSSQIQQTDFELLSKKEKVLGRCYVSDQTRELFKQLETSGLKLPTTARGIDLMMDQACKVAGMPKRLNQHLVRKTFVTKCIDLGLTDSCWKVLVFKKVHSSDATYWLNPSKAKPHWQRVVDALPLVSKANGRFGAVEQELSELKEALTSLEKENTTLKVRVNNLQSNTMELEGRLNDYGELLANWVEFGKFSDEEKEAIRRKWKIREFSQEEKQWTQEVMTVATDLQKEKGFLDEEDTEEVKRRLKPLLEKRKEESEPDSGRP
jgi:regulator of replication initiation timing